MLSPARARILCAGNRGVFFLLRSKRDHELFKGEDTFFFPQPLLLLVVFFLSVIFVLFFLAHLCSIYGTLHRVLDE